ncbi:hypothetical protein F4815DRAFT_454952 [Daldinia loculata]|nr:hypothetical protein F4815DRAFT_454952 [Daldinia loculata]
MVANQFPCTICPYVAQSQPNLNEHNRYNHIGLDCLFQGCNVRETSETGLRAHIASAHGNVDAVNGLHRCPWENCTRSFSTTTSLYRCLYFHTHDTMTARGQVSHAIGNLSNQVTQIIAHLDGLDARLNGLDARLGGLDARFDGFEAQLTVLNNNSNAMLTSITAMPAVLQAIVANASRAAGPSRESGAEEEEEGSGRATKRSRP